MKHIQAYGAARNAKKTKTKLLKCSKMKVTPLGWSQNKKGEQVIIPERKRKRN